MAIIKEFEEKLSNYEYELVFIDNFSTDGTREEIEELCNRNDCIKAIFNAKNFGQFNSPFMVCARQQATVPLRCVQTFKILLT